MVAQQQARHRGGLAAAAVDPQLGMFDVEIDDEELEADLLAWIGLAEQRKANNALAKRIKEGKERIGLRGLQDGQRVRLGELTFEAAVTDREGHEVKPVHSVRMKGIRRLGD